MGDEGRRYEGGLAEAGGARTAAGGDGPYVGFVAYEVTPTMGITLVHVSGEVRVPNPGVKAVLSRASPQGPNRNVLLLRLDLIQRPGYWPSIEVLVPAVYVGLAMGGSYTDAQITNPQLGDHTVPFTR